MIFDPNMTSAKPYLIKALHEWICDNGLTPLVVVDVDFPGVRVPNGVAEDGQVVLNVSYDAARDIQMDSELLDFNARFGGVSHAVIIPMAAISAIYARENNKGMMFEVEPASNPADIVIDKKEKTSKKPTTDSAKTSNKSHLKLVD